MPRVATLVGFQLAFFVLTSISAAVNDEGQALLAFRQLITSDPRNAFSSWQSGDATPCGWSGIYCDEFGNVSRIVLPNLQLAGTISPQLSKLSSLRAIVLPNNSLTGSIPPEVAVMRSLWKINVSDNALSGMIPGNINSEGSLRMLDLSGNSFIGSIPVAIFANCGRLRYIDFSRNLLSGGVPVSVANCQKLEGINLAGNAFNGSIPNELGQLSVLNYLSLSNNALSGFIPDSLGNCTALNYLDLSSNQLTGQIPIALAALNNITFFSVGQNLLSGEVSSSLLYHPILQHLNISFNGFTGSLLSAGDCSSLEVLDLSSNHFTGPIPIGIFSCAELKFMNVSNNLLSGAIPKQVGNLSSLRSVDMSSNNITGGVPPEIGSLNSLSILRLGSNPDVQGSIPSEIGKIADLIILELPNMGLQGDIPLSLSDCRFLLELDLSHNNLGGTIPASFSNFTYLESLNLAANNLSGSIPLELGSLSNLEALDLSVNTLSGNIPPYLGNITTLSFLNVSYNSLSGQIPRNGALEKFNASSFFGNAGLCGTPLAISCSSLGSSTKKNHVLRASAIAAIVAIAVIALGVLITFALSFRTVKKMTQDRVYESAPPSPDASPILGKIVLFSKTLPAKYEDWETGSKALLDKDCIIGTGSIGTVYRATFDAGVSMAVKKLETLGRIKNAEEFEEEIGRLANVRHPNLVAMQGYFWSSTMQLLLSDFIPNRSLYSHLHERDDGHSQLNWKRRFRIALGTARGLAYLHHDCRPPIVHYALKSSNILLDYNYEPHISDYGLGKLLPILDTYVSSTKFFSTLGYIAPELACQSVRLSDRCDVYSFGVILLELATGRHPVENYDVDCVVLCDNVRLALEEGRGESCIDPNLGSSSAIEIMQVLKLGLVCTSSAATKRPSMAEVVQVLESIKSSTEV